MGFHPAELARLDADSAFCLIAVSRAGNASALENDRYFLSHRNVRSAADDLERIFFPAHIDHADVKMIRVRMRLTRQNFSYDDLVQISVKLLIVLYFGAGQCHPVRVFAGRDIKIRNIFFDPRK